MHDTRYIDTSTLHGVGSNNLTKLKESHLSQASMDDSLENEDHRDPFKNRASESFVRKPTTTQPLRLHLVCGKTIQNAPLGAVVAVNVQVGGVSAETTKRFETNYSHQSYFQKCRYGSPSMSSRLSMSIRRPFNVGARAKVV